MNEYAPGIPDKSKKSSIPAKTKAFITNYVLHSHAADRAGQHYDFRINIDGKAYSWACRNFPFKPREKTLGVRQPDHTTEYMKFSGTIKDGYGKGKVSIKESGVCKVHYSDTNQLKVTLLSGQDPKVIFMKYLGEDNWLMFNTTPIRTEDLPVGKESYKNLTNKDITDYLKSDKYAIQPKIDGSHNLLVLKKDKRPLIISHREAKRNSLGIINHTERFQNLLDHKVPKELQGVYRGEVYGVKKDTQEVIPAEELGGILNSSISKSLDLQNKKNIELKMALFGLPNSTQENISKKFGSMFETLETAYNEEQKVKLLDSIRSGKHNRTSEGIVIVDKDSGQTIKYRFRPDYDVYIKDIFKGEGKYSGTHAGGFLYSRTPTGPILGKVGTGFSDQVRKDMLDYPGKYKGKVATIHAAREMPSGALFQPSFVRMHLDK